MTPQRIRGQASYRTILWTCALSLYRAATETASRSPDGVPGPVPGVLELPLRCEGAIFQELVLLVVQGAPAPVPDDAGRAAANPLVIAGEPGPVPPAWMTPCQVTSW